MGSLSTTTTTAEANANYAIQEPVAIIGIDMKFPREAVSAESFFEML